MMAIRAIIKGQVTTDMHVSTCMHVCSVNVCAMLCVPACVCVCMCVHVCACVQRCVHTCCVSKYIKQICDSVYACIRVYAVDQR